MRAGARPMRVLLVFLSLVAVAGCGGRAAPTHFYLLAPQGKLASPAGDANAVTVGVGPVRLPPYLDRPQVVTRRGQDEIGLSEFELWGEPLADGVPRAIAEDLRVLLPGARIALFPWVGPRVVQYQLLVDVVRFDGSLGGDVTLEAGWRILGDDRKDVREGRFTHSEATGEPGYVGLVGAMSRSLGALSREIAAALPAR
jgi:uncharacterized protein